MENFPNDLAPTYECASELASLGPVAALLTLIIGIPIIKIILRYLKLAFEKYDYIDQGLENFLFRIVSVALWVLVILTAANELGINVTGIVAALGIVGLAVAFASKDTMENIIAGIFIIIDRPFREGDRMLLTKDAVANFSHRHDMQLRVRIRLGLTPTWANVTKAEVIVKDIAKNHPDICQEKPKPPEAVLRDFGDQDVIMEIRYYVENPKQMRPSKSFFVTEILRRFGEEKVTLAFPVRINMNSDVELSDLGF